jgi:hypothetical protein
MGSTGYPAAIYCNDGAPGDAIAAGTPYGGFAHCDGTAYAFGQSAGSQAMPPVLPTLTGTYRSQDGTTFYYLKQDDDATMLFATALNFETNNQGGAAFHQGIQSTLVLFGGITFSHGWSDYSGDGGASIASYDQTGAGADWAYVPRGLVKNNASGNSAVLAVTATDSNGLPTAIAPSSSNSGLPFPDSLFSRSANADINSLRVGSAYTNNMPALFNQVQRLDVASDCSYSTDEHTANADSVAVWGWVSKVKHTSDAAPELDAPNGGYKAGTGTYEDTVCNNPISDGDVEFNLNIETPPPGYPAYQTGQWMTQNWQGNFNSAFQGQNLQEWSSTFGNIVPRAIAGEMTMFARTACCDGTYTVHYCHYTADTCYSTSSYSQPDRWPVMAPDSPGDALLIQGAPLVGNANFRSDGSLQYGSTHSIHVGYRDSGGMIYPSTVDIGWPGQPAQMARYIPDGTMVRMMGVAGHDGHDNHQSEMHPVYSIDAVDPTPSSDLTGTWAGNDMKTYYVFEDPATAKVWMLGLKCGDNAGDATHPPCDWTHDANCSWVVDPDQCACSVMAVGWRAPPSKVPSCAMVPGARGSGGVLWPVVMMVVAMAVRRQRRSGSG